MFGRRIVLRFGAVRRPFYRRRTEDEPRGQTHVSRIVPRLGLLCKRRGACVDTFMNGAMTPRHGSVHKQRGEVSAGADECAMISFTSFRMTNDVRETNCVPV